VWNLSGRCTRSLTVDATGAGDAFAGTLAVYLARGDLLIEAGTFAGGAAALATTQFGTAEASLGPVVLPSAGERTMRQTTPAGSWLGSCCLNEEGSWYQTAQQEVPIMDVRSVMTSHPACCGPMALLPEVAQLMIDHDCGEIPIVDVATGKPMGVITDRDITVRAVAKGMHTAGVVARDCMSAPVVTVSPESSVARCAGIMEDNQLRRVLVVDDAGCLCGIVAQADLARKGPMQVVAEVVKDVSRPPVARV
jgi:CBS domain-containing protein